MNDTFSNTNNCCCHSKNNDELKKKLAHQVKNSFRFTSLSSVIFSILIAIFPNCSLCLTANLSLLCFLLLLQLPYTFWLLPILLLLVAIYLIILYWKSPKNYYVPFQLSLSGAIFLLIGKLFFPFENWITILGMIFIVTNSIWINIGVQVIEFFLSKQNHKL